MVDDDPLELDRRASEPGDKDALFALRAEALRRIVEGWHEDVERTVWTSGFRAGDHVVALDDDEIAAYWRVVRRRNEVFVAELFVSSLHRGRGIASSVLRQLIDEAARDGLAVSIHVPPRAEPLLRLLRFLGFVVVPSPERGRSRLIWRA